MIKHTARRHSGFTPAFWKRWLYLVFFISLFLGIYYWQTKSSIFINNNWRKNIVFYSRPVAILSITSNETDDTYLLLFPQNSFINVPYGYGNYRLENIWKLGVLEKKPYLYKDTLADLLAVNINTQIAKDNQIVFNNDDQISQIKKELSFFSILKNTPELNFYDKIILFTKIISLRQDKLKIYNLNDVPQLTTENKLPDDTKIINLNTDVLDNFLESKFEDELVRNEGLTVEIQNSTNIVKLGQKFGRYISHIGGKIIAINSIEGKLKNCEILFDKANEQKQLIKYLKKEFNCDKKYIQNDKQVDVIIKLGEVWAKRLID